MAEQQVLAQPKVFISYSWTSIEHRDRIRRYAERLRENHVDVVLDIWDLAAGQDKNVYMEKMVADPSVTHVLAFIDKRYTEKANARKDGVGTESQIISQRLYSSTDQTKFIPIFCEKDESGKLSAPFFFESRIGFDFSTPNAENDNWEPLIRFLFGKPEFTKPALGPMPAFLDEKNAPVVLPTNRAFARFKEVCNKSLSGPKVAAAEYVDLLLAHLDEFRVRKLPGQKELEVYDETVQVQLNKLLPLRNQAIEWMDMQILLSKDEDLVEFFKDLFPRLSDMRGCPPELTSWVDGAGLFDAVEVWIYEVVLYTVALLIKHKRDVVLHAILFARYYMRGDYNRSKKDLYGISELYSQASSFYNRNLRLNLSRMDLLADWVKEHALGRYATFEELMGADGVLYLACQMKQMQTYWWPRTYVYAEWGGRQISLFDSARDMGCAKRLLTIFGYKDIEALKAVVAELYQNRRSSNRVIHYFFSSIQYDQWGTLT